MDYSPYEGIMKKNDNPICNPEGYKDITPHDALAQDFPKRGDVRYIDDKLVLIVSRNENNEKSNSVNLVYLFPEKSVVALETHVDVGKYEARCEKICSYRKDRIGKVDFVVSDDVMLKIEKAMLVSLGIVADEPKGEVLEYRPENERIVLETERNMYKKLYEQLLARITRDKA